MEKREAFVAGTSPMRSPDARADASAAAGSTQECAVEGAQTGFFRIRIKDEYCDPLILKDQIEGYVLLPFFWGGAALFKLHA